MESFKKRSKNIIYHICKMNSFRGGCSHERANQYFRESIRRSVFIFYPL